ncbi:MAG TPA: hypothetical protein VMW76_06835 [Bacteroidales bacterium]|nr:hypothetical protein [Bacteroidales bacterium]
MRLGRLLIWITLFGISMAFLESSVVIYIRDLLYPGGFDFPLAVMEGSLAITEILREAATLVMIAGAAVIAGRNSSERFAWFIYCFAIWDIFYYVFLKLLIGWPESILAWDVLFLIPVTWTGPVLSPIIVCCYMLCLSGIIIFFTYRGIDTRIRLKEWILLIAGALILIIAFTWDYSSFILRNYSISELINLPSAEPMFDLATRYLPEKFNWWLFIAGSLPILGSIAMIFSRHRSR